MKKKAGAHTCLTGTTSLHHEMLAETKILCQDDALRSSGSALPTLVSLHRQDMSWGPCPSRNLGSWGSGFRALRCLGLLLEVIDLKNSYNLKVESYVLSSGNFGAFKSRRQHLK